MLKYIIPFLVYVVTWPLVSYLFKNDYLGYVVRVILTAILLVYYLKNYKELKKFKFDFFAILTGVIIFVVWISLESIYPRTGGELVNPYSLGSLAIPFIVFKLIGLVLVAPLVEELFTRSFLIRVFIDRDFEKVPIGKFTVLSFVLTVLFFGFSHSMWLPGLITGVILNLLIYKRKNLWSCIQAHAVANIILVVYVLATQNWMFW